MTFTNVLKPYNHYKTLNPDLKRFLNCFLVKNNGFLSLFLAKTSISTDVRDRRSNVTNVRTSGKASLA